MLSFALISASLLCVTASWPAHHFPSERESDEVRSAAIKRLLEVFGMDDPPAVHAYKQPPQYMLDLYNTVADVDGVTKDPYLLEGNTVRSFFDKCKLLLFYFFNTFRVEKLNVLIVIFFFIAVHSEQVEFKFNLSSVARSEKVLTAELHLFKLRPQLYLTFSRHHFCQVCSSMSIIQLLHAEEPSCCMVLSLRHSQKILRVSRQ